MALQLVVRNQLAQKEKAASANVDPGWRRLRYARLLLRQLRHALLQLLEPADCTATKVPDPSNTDAWALPPQINRTIDCKWDSGTSQVSRLTSRVDIKVRAASARTAL